MGIFLDTAFLMGLSHPDDKFHATSSRILHDMSSGKYGLIYTSPLVISETATLILIRSKNNLSLLKNFYSYLYGAESFIRILPWTPQIEQLTWSLFLDVNQKAKDRKYWLNFVDTSNIAYCRHNQIQNIASYDKHFDTFLIRIY